MTLDEGFLGVWPEPVLHLPPHAFAISGPVLSSEAIRPSVIFLEDSLEIFVLGLT